MKNSKQSQFSFTDSRFIKPTLSFGGSLLKGNPKTKRPIDSKNPIHLSIKSKKGVLRLPKAFALIETIIDQMSKRFGVTIYRKANVGNHIHMAIKVPIQEIYTRFIKALTGRIAQKVGNVLGIDLSEGFWQTRPFTRIVKGWKKAFKTLLDYIKLNQLEAHGFISRTEIKTLVDLRRVIGSGP